MLVWTGTKENNFFFISCVVWKRVIYPGFYRVFLILWRATLWECFEYDFDHRQVEDYFVVVVVCFGFFLKQNSPELVSSGGTFPWCSNSVKSWTAQIAACQPNMCSTSFFFSPPSTPYFQTPWNVSFSWRCLRCSGGSGVEWRCQWCPCAA